MDSRPGSRASIFVKSLSTLCLQFAVMQAVYAQSDSIPAFNKIRTPASPAFVLLGVTPTAVERPNTPAGIAVTALNRMNGVSALPNDFAMEFSPYWLFGHPRLTWQSDTTRNIGESVLRTMTVSGATASIGDSSSSVTGISLAIRMALVSGTMSGRSRLKLHKLDSVLAAEATSFNLLLNDKAESLDREKQHELESAGNNDEARKAIRARYAVLDEKIKHEVFASLNDAKSKDAQCVEEFSVEREGFFLELATGLVWDSRDKTAENTTLSRTGVWLTPSYQWENFSLVGVARYLGDQHTSAGNAADFGIRGIYTVNKFAGSFEYVRRVYTATGGPAGQSRYAGNLEYNVAGEIWVQGTFGSDYARAAKGSLLAQLGVALNFSQKRFTTQSEDTK
jgi:hypothetical protein